MTGGRDQTAGGAANAGECGDFPVVQWLRLCALSAEGPGLIPGQETRAHILQLRVCMPQLKTWHATTKIPCAATKTRHSQINKKIKILPKKQRRMVALVKEVPVGKEGDSRAHPMWQVMKQGESRAKSSVCLKNWRLVAVFSELGRWGRSQCAEEEASVQRKKP